MISPCQEGKSSPDALRRSAGIKLLGASARVGASRQSTFTAAAWLEVDPSREDGRFHGHRPWLGKCFHPQFQRQSCGGYRTCCVDTATAVLHAVADRFLVNIQTDVVHSLHGGASLVVSESAWSLSSAFLHQALLHDLFIQTIRESDRDLFEWPRTIDKDIYESPCTLRPVGARCHIGDTDKRPK